MARCNKKNQSRVLAVITTFLLAATFFLLQTDSHAGLILKFLVSKLVYSTSDAAALFLLGFAALALLCRHLKLSGKLSAISIMLMWAGMLVGYLVNLVATITYHLEHHIPFSAHVYHWSEGINSYTAFFHSHLGKSAIAQVTGTLLGNANYDTGTALVASVPPFQIWLIGIGFLIAMIGTLGWMPIFHTRFGKRPALTAVYLVASATAIKSILDGGLLAYSVIPSLLLMGSFHVSQDEPAWRYFWCRRGWIIGFALLAAYASLLIHLTNENTLPLIGPWLFFITLLILLATTSWQGVAAWCCRGIMLAYLLINCAFDYGDNLAPLLRDVGIDHRATKFDTSGRGISQPLQPLYGKPVFHAYRALGDDPWKPRSTLFWEVPARGLNSFHASVRLLSLQGDSGVFSPAPSLRITQITSANAGWLDIDVDGNLTESLPPIFLYGNGNALSKNNYYVWMYQIDLLLRNAGWQSYILLPHTLGNASTGNL